jgi:hypothetical protein
MKDKAWVSREREFNTSLPQAVAQPEGRSDNIEGRSDNIEKEPEGRSDKILGPRFMD